MVILTIRGLILKMKTGKKKKLAAIISIVSNISLTVLKIFAGIISGSLSIISEAIHSISDFLASLITFFSVVKSSEPADEDHPYGHGKYEDMAGFIEGLLIIFASIFIVYKSAKKIILGLPMESENTVGIAVMLAAVVINIFVSSILFRVAKETNSISLYADAEHLRTDVYSSFGVFAGLVLIKITGHSVLDPIIAILVAMFIYKAGYTISRRAWMNLLDHSLPDEDIQKIESVVNSLSSDAELKKNSIKARQMGPLKDINLTLQFPRETSLCECHRACDEVEKQIKALFGNACVSIHSEPNCYKRNCQNLCKKEL